ncbi:MAG: hypothetical protein LBG15_05140 [Dysgonamonadaceae bacterium]|jgi:hypothetical protein|nr:hypothetical protein [Dysgonamonadaceae bacterium]
MANKYVEKLKNDLFEEGGVSGEKGDTMENNDLVNALLRGDIVVIPDFGYLEPKSLGGRRTVLFKSANPQDALMQQFSVPPDALCNRISDSLKKGEVVSLPEAGIFRPVKKEDGSTAVSFVLSSFLRKKLAGEEEKEIQTETAEEKRTEEKTLNSITAKEENNDTNETIKKDVVSAKPKIEIKTQKINTQNIARKGDSIIPDDEVISIKRKNYAGLLLLVFASVAVLIIIFSVWFQNKKEEPPASEVRVTKSINLPYLAEQNYGNPVFWVYIYEANQNRLISPVNIPEETDLIIPDLYEEYNVDVTDSMEIKRALMKSEIILKQINNVNLIEK